MKVVNRATKDVIEATKNDDGTYTVEGETIKADEMGRKYMKYEPKKEEPEVDVGVLVTHSESGMSDDIGKLAMALSQCQGEFEAVKKGTKAFNYNYADLEAVLAASREITSKHGLAVSQLNMSKTIGSNLLIGVKTILMHSSGQYIWSEIYVPAQQTKSNTLVQMSGVNITYLRRYGLQSILGLATTDTDGK